MSSVCDCYMPIESKFQLTKKILETIAPADAKMILRAKNKALSISVEAVKIAFPGISKGW